MSEDMPPLDDAPDVTAAEFALGLLDGDERAAAMRRLLSDRAFAAEVERWRTHFADLFDLWPAADASDRVFGRVEQSLDSAPMTTRDKPVSARVWRNIAGLSTLVAAGLMLVLLMRPAPGPVIPAPHPVQTAPAATPMLAAAIAPVGPGSPAAAMYDPATGGLRLTAMSLADAAKAQELWVIAGDGVPHSLGIVPLGTSMMVTVTPANRARLAAGATLAVSIEPAGGSPTGLPTGPVVAKGALSQV